MASLSESTPDFARLYRAGISRRLVKSPAAPKITIVAGGATRPDVAIARALSGDFAVVLLGASIASQLLMRYRRTACSPKSYTGRPRELTPSSVLSFKLLRVLCAADP